MEYLILLYLIYSVCLCSFSHVPKLYEYLYTCTPFRSFQGTFDNMFFPRVIAHTARRSVSVVGGCTRRVVDRITWSSAAWDFFFWDQGVIKILGAVLVSNIFYYSSGISSKSTRSQVVDALPDMRNHNLEVGSFAMDSSKKTDVFGKQLMYLGR